MEENIQVLLIDSNPDFIKANSIILEICGFDVLSASSGVEGLDKAQSEKPDIVVLDLMMDKADEGFSLARKIRKKLDKEVRIIILSSLTQETGYTFTPEEHPDYFQADLFAEKSLDPSSLQSDTSRRASFSRCSLRPAAGSSSPMTWWWSDRGMAVRSQHLDSLVLVARSACWNAGSNGIQASSLRRSCTVLVKPRSSNSLTISANPSLSESRTLKNTFPPLGSRVPAAT